MTDTRAASIGDGFALGLSSLCLAHCLALPLVASLLPLAGAWAEAEWVHWLFAALAAPLSFWALLRTSRPSPALLGLAVLGLSLLVAGAAGFPSHEAETPVSVAGSLALASAHILNWRRRARARCDH